MPWPVGGGDRNPDKRLPAASSSSSCARSSCILLGTSGVILHSQLASVVLADYVSRPKRAITRTVVAKER